MRRPHRIVASGALALVLAGLPTAAATSAAHAVQPHAAASSIQAPPGTPWIQDPSFVGEVSGTNWTIHTLTVLDDGDLLVTTPNGYIDGQRVPGMVRLNPDGSVDTDTPFNTNIESVFGAGSQIQQFAAVEIMPDGDMVAAGVFRTRPAESIQNLVRINADGTLDQDTGFNTNPSLIPHAGEVSLAALPDGTLVISTFWLVPGGPGPGPRRSRQP